MDYRTSCSSSERRPRVAVFESLAIAGSLAASNCCVIQLLLNYFSLGCAGFSALDRWKPYSTALTAVSCAALLSRARGCRQRSAWLVCLLSAALLLSQHALSAYNKGLDTGTVASHAARMVTPAWLQRRVVAASIRWRRRHQGRCRGGGGGDEGNPYGPQDCWLAAGASQEVAADPSLIAHGGQQQQAGRPLGGPPVIDAEEGAASLTMPHGMPQGDSNVRRHYRFRVDGLKCEGCAARLKGALEAVDGVLAASVDFGLREVRLVVVAGSAADGSEPLRHAIRVVDSGYSPEELAPIEQQ